MDPKPKDAIQPKGILPYGWQVKVSKKYPDRVYYFNLNTGSTTWDCPELDPPREMPKTDGNVESKIVFKPNEPLLPKEIKMSSNVTKKLKQDAKKHCSKFFPACVHPVNAQVPPTAVVVPVVNKFRIQPRLLRVAKPNFDLQDSPSTSDQSIINVPSKKLKRNSDSFEDVPEGPKKRQRKSRKNKKKKSPLLRSDSELEQKAGDEKDKQQPKKRENISPICLDVDTLEKSEKDVLENAAANKEAEDIEMLDVSMEIIEQITSKKETVVDDLASYYIVVDTNVFISELHLIKELKDTPVDGCGPPHIFIPWVVIHELDHLKSTHAKASIRRAACDAIRYLNSVLKTHPRFHGQSPAEAQAWAKTYSKCNDDRILECCMALGDKMNPEKVILLTNDKNLVNKALICSIVVHNWASMMESVKPDVVFSLSKNDERRRNKERETRKAESTVVSSKSSEDDAEDQIIVKQRNIYKQEIHTLMCTARQLLKNVVAQFVHDEMFKAYGQIWLSFPIQKRLLEGLLKAIKDYWKMVFSEFLDDNDLRNFELLYKTASRPEGFLADKDECLTILSTIEDVFHQLKKKRPKLKVPVERIQEFRTTCMEAFYTFCKLENTIKDAEQKLALAVFERNWSTINQLCGMFLDFCKIDHEFQYDKPTEVPQEQAMRQLLCKFYPGVEKLKTLMFRMLESLRNNRPTKEISKKLYAALINFIPSLKIKYEPFSYPQFSAKTLELFCVSPQNREMIEIGFKQIDKFFSKMKEALHAFMSSNIKKNSDAPEMMICD